MNNEIRTPLLQLVALTKISLKIANLLLCRWVSLHKSVISESLRGAHANSDAGMFATKHIDGRRESKIKQNPHNIKTIQKLYDLLSYYSTIPNSLKSKPAHYQVPNVLLIFLKGGPVDKILFGMTITFCAIGMANMFYTIYGMSYPKKKH